MRGLAIAGLHEGLQFLLKHKVLLIEELHLEELQERFQEELRASAYSKATSYLVQSFQKPFQRKYSLQINGEVDQSTAQALNETLEEHHAFVLDKYDEKNMHKIMGTVKCSTNSAINGLTVRVSKITVNKGLHLGETTTQEKGTFLLYLEKSRIQKDHILPDLQASVWYDDKLLAVSEIRYNINSPVILDMHIDKDVALSLPSEYETLIGTLADHFDGKLRNLVETDNRPNITYLANKTGWDARAVAMASLGDKFSSQFGGNRIKSELFYALFRFGLPADPRFFFLTDLEIVQSIWQQAAKQGVIPSQSESTLSSALQQLKDESIWLLHSPPMFGLSSFREILQGVLGEDQEQQYGFMELYIHYRTNMSTFWRKIEQIFPEYVERLKLDGKLAYMTLNNAPIIRKIHQSLDISDPLELVGGGFYRAEKWLELIDDESVPVEIIGKDQVTKKRNYSEYLAANLRFSFPVAVVAEMKKNGETQLATETLAQDARTHLQRLLDISITHSSIPFEIVPLSKWHHFIFSTLTIEGGLFIPGILSVPKNIKHNYNEIAGELIDLASGWRINVRESNITVWISSVQGVQFGDKNIGPIGSYS